MPLNHFYLEWTRSFSLFAHILLTTVLYWTKFDSIQVTLSSYSNDLEFTRADETFTGLISVSIIFLLLEVVFRASEIDVTLWTLIHVFLDSCACFFITWIVLDGLAWETYIYVFFFCSLIPTVYDVSNSVQNSLMRLRVKSKGTSCAPI